MDARTDERKEKKSGAEALQDIANITGRPGLYRILKPGRSGVIIESLDEKKEKSIASASAKVSVLKDVSVYVTAPDTESVALSDVFLKIRETHGEEVALDVKTASEKDYVEFLSGVLPEYDRSRVYNSDIRKIVIWYGILSRYVPELFAAEESTDTGSDGRSEEAEVEAAPDEAK